MFTKSLLTILLIVAASCRIYANEEKEFILPKYEWIVSTGNPCMIVFKPQHHAVRTRKTYFFNPQGELKALLLEDLDGPGSSRPVIIRLLYAFDPHYNVIGVKQINYNYGTGGKIIPHETLYNNYAKLKSEQIHYRDGGLNSVSPTQKDSKGNWLEGENHSSAPGKPYPISRKIYYYNEDPKSEAKTQKILAEADSLVQYCNANKWSVSERNAEERKNAHGFWWNLLLPALISAVVSLVAFNTMCGNRKISNLLIMIITGFVIYFIGNYLVIPLGPYGHLWTVLYWIITFIVGARFLSGLLAKRCPRCGAYDDLTLLSRIFKTKTKEEFTKRGDDPWERTSKQVEHTTEDTYKCHVCGCTWKHTMFGHVKD